MPSRGFLFFGHRGRRHTRIDQEVRQCATPWWKKIGEVAIEIAAATVVILTTVFIERCLRTAGDESSGSSTLEPDGDEGAIKV